MGGILNFFEVIIDFLSMMFTSVVNFWGMIPGMMTALSGSFVFAPSFLLPFLQISVSLTLIFAILRLLP